MQLRRIVLFSFPLGLATVLAACGTLETTASVAKAGVSVVGTTVSTTANVAKTTADLGLKTVSTAATVGSVAMSAGSAAVSAGAAAKNASAATAAVAVAGAVAVGSAVKWGIEFSRSNELQFAPVVADGANIFVTKEGARVATSGCDASRANEPALLVINRSGEYHVRSSTHTDARNCPVLSIHESKQANQ
jgi:hypothetical protein